MAWLFLGFVVLFPSAGLSLVDQGNPHRYLPFIARHASMFWVVNILGALVAGLLSAVVYMALHDRFKDESPATARIGSFAGTMGAAAFAAAPGPPHRVRMAVDHLRDQRRRRGPCILRCQHRGRVAGGPGQRDGGIRNSAVWACHAASSAVQ